MVGGLTPGSNLGLTTFPSCAGMFDIREGDKIIILSEFALRH